MAGVSVQLALGTMTTWPAWLIALLSLVLLLRTRLNTTWIIVMGAIFGMMT